MFGYLVPYKPKFTGVYRYESESLSGASCDKNLYRREDLSTVNSQPSGKIVRISLKEIYLLRSYSQEEKFLSLTREIP